MYVYNVCIISIYIYIYIHMCIYIYIYIYISKTHARSLGLGACPAPERALFRRFWKFEFRSRANTPGFLYAPFAECRHVHMCIYIYIYTSGGSDPVRRKRGPDLTSGSEVCAESSAQVIRLNYTIITYRNIS